MNCHSGNGTVLKDKNCSVTLVAGEKDKIHAASYVERVYKDYKKRGFHTKYENLPMGHSWAPLNKKIEYLDFMYSYQKFANKNLTNQELISVYEQLEKVEIKRISEDPNKKKAMGQFKSFLAVAKLMKSKLGLRIYQEWGKAAAHYINDLKAADPAAAYFFIIDPENSALIKKAPSQEKSTIAAHLRDLQRNKLVIAEVKADKDFQYYVRTMKRVKDKKAADRLIPKIEKFIEKYQGTKAAAKAAIADLRKVK